VRVSVSQAAGWLREKEVPKDEEEYGEDQKNKKSGRERLRDT
jgi:hypothetical protein